MTNSERRISRVRAVVPPLGEAKPDWKIAVEFSRKLFPEKSQLMKYETAEEVFAEHRESTRGRDLDITGLSYPLLDERGPQQWPYPEGARDGKKRLYEDGVFPTANGRARFVATPYRTLAEPPDDRYPLRLNTGRLRDQWHSMSRTGTIPRLFAHEPEPRLKVNPADLARFNVKDGDLARVSSRRGALHIQAAGDTDVPPGMVFLAMHWGARYLGGADSGGVNGLTIGALDPSSKQPELKHCAVRIEPADLPWRIVAFGRAGSASSIFNALDPVMSSAPYAVRTLIGRDEAGVRISLASQEPLPAPVVRLIDAAFALDAADGVRYEGGLQCVALEGDTVRAVRLSGDTGAERWMRDAWERGLPVPQLRRLPALPVDTQAMRGARTLCGCFDVAESQIDAFLSAPQASLSALQASLKCGTNCGSCMPEIRRKIAERARAPVPA
jgi:assimilatory nitrate reductase catalytic subunit